MTSKSATDAHGDRLEARVPPGLALADRLGRVRAAGVDPREVPASGKKALHHRAGEGGQQIHGVARVVVDRLSYREVGVVDPVASYFSGVIGLR